jgi:phage gpG-like protein
MSRFTGDISKLGLVSANLAKLASVPSQVAGDASEGIAQEIRNEFDAGTDPYGRAWAALQAATLAKGRTPPPLTDSGDTIDSLEVKPSAGAGITIEFGTEYAGFHQVGTVDMVARPPLPIGGFPSSWSKVISDAASARIEKAMR